MKFDSSKIKSVHLEITDKCNASCPMCPRSDHGGQLNQFINKNEMTLSKAKIIFDAEFLKQLNFLQLCGNFGDPIVAKETLEILDYFRSVNPRISLGVHTNGSARTTDWWQRLGVLLSGPNDYCKFGLDGLEDTNHIYRRNTHWSKIMQSVSAFIAAGGNAHWEFLVFKHNQHQIEEAKNLSIKMGFKKFFVKKTSRFFNYKTGLNEPYSIYDENRNTIGVIEAPTDSQFINAISTSGGELQTAPAQVNSENLVTKSCIECASIVENQIYISSRGEVFPCCFIAGEPYYSFNGTESQHLRSLFSDGQDSMNQAIAGQNQTILDVVRGPLFKEIESQFTKNDSPIQSCQRICKKDFKIVKAEYQ